MQILLAFIRGGLNGQILGSLITLTIFFMGVGVAGMLMKLWKVRSTVRKFLRARSFLSRISFMIHCFIKIQRNNGILVVTIISVSTSNINCVPLTFRVSRYIKES